MRNKIFVIKDLGIFEFVVSLVRFDYPVVFVAKKVGSSNEFFLFDEIKNDEHSVSWAATQVSYDQLDLLNKGRIKLSDCFVSERGAPKSGFLVTSVSDQERATKIDVRNIASIIEHPADYYVDSFAGNNHGINLLSLVSGHKIVGIVTDDRKYVSPFINGTYAENIIKTTKSFINSLPHKLVVNGYNFSTNHSTVVSIELGIKESKDDSRKNYDLLNLPDFEKDVDDFIELLKKVMSTDCKEEEIIHDFYGDVKSIQKATELVTSIKNANPKGNVYIDFSSNVKHTEKEEKQIVINKKTALDIKNRNKKIVDIIDNSDNVDVSEIVLSGTFEMFDGSKKNGRFVFKDQSGVFYSGISNVDVDELKGSGIPMVLFKRKYDVTISQTVYKLANKNSKPIYKLIKVQNGQNYNQEQLVF